MKSSYIQQCRLILFSISFISVTSFALITVNRALGRQSLQHQLDNFSRSTWPRPKPSFSSQESSNIRRNMIPHDISSSSFWTAVEFFDGSTIVDPVVVSNVFWTRLQSNFVSFVLGQFLAAIVFTFLLSLARSQFSALTSFVSEKLFSSSTNISGRQQLNIPSNLREGYVGTIQPDFVKLLVCLAIDVIGSSSTLIPILGDASDLIWAPVAGLLLRSLFNGSNVVFALEFTEEILPLTDILPLATVCWVIDTFFQDSSVASLLQLGKSGNRVEQFDAIDVDPIEIPNRKSKERDSIAD